MSRFPFFNHKTENSSLTQFNTGKCNKLNVEHIKRLHDYAWKKFHSCPNSERMCLARPLCAHFTQIHWAVWQEQGTMLRMAQEESVMSQRHCDEEASPWRQVARLNQNPMHNTRWGNWRGKHVWVCVCVCACMVRNVGKSQFWMYIF